MGKPKGPFARWATRNISHPLEAVLIGGFWGLCRLLPLDAASSMGGALGRLVGPLLPGDGTARRNLDLAMPGLDKAAKNRIIRAMWDNLGRTLAEYPHLEQISRDRVEVVGRDVLDQLRDDGKAAFFISGHIANWEAQIPTVRRAGLETATVYRAPNNRFVDRMIAGFRGDPPERMIPKGPEGAKKFMRALVEGAHVCMLVDQKMNDGVEARFFGRPAMTAPAAARLALRRKLPVATSRIERLEGARFRETFTLLTDLPPDDSAESVAALTQRLNDIVESWVRERPGQWLWMHRRWPDSK